MEIRDNGSSNPLIIVAPDEVYAWLRERANEAGYADREVCAVQVDHNGLSVPSLVVMVSNIPHSRGQQ